MKADLQWKPLMLAFAALLSVGAKPEVWYKVQLPKITLISALSKEETQAWAIELHQFEDGICYVFKIPPSSLSPLTVLAFRSDREFSAYKPLKNGRPLELSGFFSRTQFSNTAGVSGELGADDRRALYHEATHWITYSGDADLPLWLAEGLAETYSTFSLKDDTLTFGLPLVGHMMLLNRERWIPIPKLLAVGAGALNYSDSDRTSLFYAESWLACHYLVFGDTTGAGVSHIGRYLEARASVNPDEAFRTAFGISPNDFEKVLRAYASQGHYRPFSARFVKPEAERAIHIDLATKAEVDLAKAQLLLGAGRVSEGRTKLTAILSANPKSGAAKKLLGLADLMDGRLVQMGGLAGQGELSTPGPASDDYRESAIQNLNEAIELGENDPDTLLATGEVITMARNQGQGGELETGQARHAADLFEEVARRQPTSLRAARGLAGIIGAVDQVRDTDVAAMRTARRRFPHDALVAVGDAVVDLESSPRETGERKLEAILKHSPPVPAGIADYARNLLAGAQKTDRLDRLTKLLNAAQFDEALPLLDAEITEAVPEDRPILQGMRRMAVCGRDMVRLVGWLNSGRVNEARPELEAIAADASLAPYNHEAAEILQKLAEGGTVQRDSN